MSPVVATDHFERLARWTLAESGQWSSFEIDGAEWWLESWMFELYEDDIRRGDIDHGMTLAEALADELHVRALRQRWAVEEVDRLRSMQRGFGICDAIMREPHRVTWWDRSRAKAWATRKAYSLGIVAGSSHTGTPWHVCTIRWRGKRPYVLGVRREWWAAFRWCVLKRLRPGERPHWPALIGDYCGKCAPWPCCGSTHTWQARPTRSPSSRPSPR